MSHKPSEENGHNHTLKQYTFSFNPMLSIYLLMSFTRLYWTFEAWDSITSITLSLGLQLAQCLPHIRLSLDKNTFPFFNFENNF